MSQYRTTKVYTNNKDPECDSDSVRDYYFMKPEQIFLSNCHLLSIGISDIVISNK